MLDCPHCYTKIIPMASGVCPSCSGDTKDRSGYDPDLTVVMIREKQDLPERCLICGQTSSKQHALTFQSEPDHLANTGQTLFGLLLLFVGGLGFVKTGGGHKHEVTLHIPLCTMDACKSSERLQPRQLDAENFRAKFLAHRRFADALGPLST